MRRWDFCVVALLLASPALADEIRLKDGTRITGTIVGLEDNSFKVQTSYGFALVRKDKIATIIPSEPKPEAKKNDAAPSRKPSPETSSSSSRTVRTGHRKDGKLHSARKY